MEFSAKVFLYTAIIVLGIRMCYEWFTRKPEKTTLTTLPPEPTDKGHWYDDIHEMD
jgi:hypothetical protein